MTDTPQKPRAVVFDIDGTLSDYTHRVEHFIPPNRDMRQFFAKMEDDAPRPEIIALAHEARSKGYRVIILTGRPSIYLAPTLRWLDKYGVPYNIILMRDADDWRPGAEVKTDIYHNHIAPRYHVLYAVDDNPKIIDMWRDLGVKTLLVGTGELPEIP